jgi:hypothetical protein
MRRPLPTSNLQTYFATGLQNTFKCGPRKCGKKQSLHLISSTFPLYSISLCFLSSQTSSAYLLLSSSRSNRRKSAAKVKYSSQYARLPLISKGDIEAQCGEAYFIPKQEREPLEKETSHLSTDAESGSSQRSGLKVLASLKMVSDLWTKRALIPTIV